MMLFQPSPCPDQRSTCPYACNKMANLAICLAEDFGSNPKHFHISLERSSIVPMNERLNISLLSCLILPSLSRATV